jgi:N-acetylmuramoyl-L-alanine amidase CwlA
MGERPLSPQGAEIMAQAYDAFDAWCRKRDPEGEMCPHELVAEWASLPAQRDMEAVR